MEKTTEKIEDLLAALDENSIEFSLIMTMDTFLGKIKEKYSLEENVVYFLDGLMTGVILKQETKDSLEKEINQLIKEKLLKEKIVLKDIYTFLEPLETQIMPENKSLETTNNPYEEIQKRFVYGTPIVRAEKKAYSLDKFPLPPRIKENDDGMLVPPPAPKSAIDPYREKPE